MPNPYLVPCLAKLRDETNTLFPVRDKESDGWIGDAAHQQTDSDHNPDPKTGAVRAIDIDRDLRGRVGMQAVVDHIVSRHKSRQDNRAKYVIFNRHIWSASNGWKVRDYTGDNPHDKHAHVSALRATEGNVKPWLEGLFPTPAPPKDEDDMPTAEEIAKAVWTYDVDGGKAGSQSAAGYLTTENARSGELRTVIEPEQAESLAALHTAVNDSLGAVLQQIAAVNERLDALVNRLPEEPAPTV